MQFWRTDIDPAGEPRRVLIKRDEWHDEKRNRTVPYKIYYPDQAGDTPLPVIIWSHGLGGTQDGAGFVGRFLASHGYIHVNIGHDGTNDSLWRGKPGHPWDNIRQSVITWETVLNRYLDVPFTLDQLKHLDIPVQPDFDTIGMSGHSFGAVTTQIMAGQKTGMDGSMDLFEPRFTAALAYSPVPNTRVKDKSACEIYGSIRMPLFHLTGTEDHSPLEGPIQHLRDEIFDHAGQNGERQLSVILHNADHMVFNGSRGQLPDYEGMDLHKDQIKILALMWWDIYLKKDHAAEQWMRDHLQDYLGVSSPVKIKNDTGSST